MHVCEYMPTVDMAGSRTMSTLWDGKSSSLDKLQGVFTLLKSPTTNS